MFAPEKLFPVEHEQMLKMNCTYRFIHTAESYKLLENGTVAIDTSKPGRQVFCEIIDLSVPGSEPFVKQLGDDEPTAYRLAVAAALVAPKPMTPAQKATSQAADAEIKALKARVAELEGEGKPATQAKADPNGPSIKRAVVKTGDIPSL